MGTSKPPGCPTPDAVGPWQGQCPFWALAISCGPGNLLYPWGIPAQGLSRGSGRVKHQAGWNMSELVPALFTSQLHGCSLRASPMRSPTVPSLPPSPAAWPPRPLLSQQPLGLLALVRSWAG